MEQMSINKGKINSADMQKLEQQKQWSELLYE